MNARFASPTDELLRAALTLEAPAELVDDVSRSILAAAAVTRQKRRWTAWPWASPVVLPPLARAGLRLAAVALVLLLTLATALLVASLVDRRSSPFSDGVLAVGGSGGGLQLIDAAGNPVASFDTRVVQGAAWSPDGRSMAFWNGLGADWTLDLLDLESRTVRPAAASGDLAAAVPALRHILDPTAAAHFLPAVALAWSPDGRRLLVSATRSGVGTLLAVDVASGAVRQITHYGTEGWFGAWSPDGTRVAWFDAQRFTDYFELYVADASDENHAQRLMPELPRDSVYQGPLAWSPDSKRLMIGAGPASILEIDPADASVLAIHDAPALDAVFGWDPTGEHIAWSTYAGRSAGSLHMMRADGSNRRELAGGVCWGGNGWSPSGDELLFTTNCTPRSPEIHVRAVSIETGEIRTIWTQQVGGVGDVSGLAWQGVPRR